MLRVIPQSPYTAVQTIDPALGFPPAPGSGPAAGLGPLVPPESLLGLVISPGVFPGEALRIGGLGIDPGIDCPCFNPAVFLRCRHWGLPVLDAEEPLAVAADDMGFEDDSLWEGMAQLDGTDDGQPDAALAVVLDLGDAGGGAEGACACGALLAKDRTPGFQVGIEPVPEGVSEVHERAFGDAAGNFGHERVVLLFAGIEGLVEVLPGWPGQVVGAAEAVGSDAEVVDEPVYADGAAAIPVLLDGEGDRDRVAGW